ncbi:META domain-containing protein [Streptomyces sp. Ru71]|uniref:META domain-containing protein n=1 Tax=Streptomyces sp. Ru71 TaxID=2080746 RepID=UPI0021562023|nr:META domain-containing protein [Streptomyces sp. Ru71]
MTLVAAAVLVPLVAACGSEHAGAGSGSGSVSPEPPVTGTHWRIESISSHGSTEHPGSTAHLRFDPKTGKAGGRLGCNHFSAAATVRDGNITLGSPTTTRMMCDASLMRTERTLLGVFNSTLKYRLEHGTLTLTCTNGTIIQAVEQK